MPRPPEDHPQPPPRPRPKPKPPKPKPKPETMKPEPVRDHQPHAVLPFPPDPFACAAHCSEPCAYHRLCPPPPPSSTATVYLRSSSSSRLPTPLIALSASVLAVSVLLLLVLLVCHVARRRRRQNATATSLPLNHHQVVQQGLPADMVVPVPADNDSDDGVHHVWYIRTVGLDERAIAAITALVYDPDKCRALGLGGDGCAVCLAEFRGGETLRLLPRCGHAFHRGCIDTWLRAHVNCPLCRAPVKATAGADHTAALGNDVVALDGEPAANLVAAAGAGAEEAGVLSTEMAVRRAASMVALPRLPWPDVSLRPLASNSAREGEMGLAKISRALKSWEALEMAGVGVGRSASFGAAPPRLPGRSGQPASGINADEIPR